MTAITHLADADGTPSRVVLLGANGFIGRALQKSLDAKSIPFLALTRADVDLGTPVSVRDLNKLLEPGDSIVFLSSIAPGTSCEGAFAANLRMADVVCGSAVSRGAAHIVYFSSDAVYPFSLDKLSERTRPNPPAEYGEMHYIRESKLMNCRIPLAILRPTMIYGQGDTHNAYGPNRMWRQAVCGGPIEIFGKGEDERDYIHVDDVVEITAAILKRRSVGTLNVASGTSVAAAQLAELIRSRFVEPPATRFIPRREAVTCRFFDTSTLRESLPGLEPAPIQVGVGRLPLDQGAWANG